MSSSDGAETGHETEPEAESGPDSESGQSVGYGKPPRNTRFKKGVSGNPKGRPKGCLNVATAFTKTLLEKVVINEHGRRKTVTQLEAALKQLAKKAASGDLRALRQVVELARDAEAKHNATSVQNPEFGEFDREVMDDILKRFQPQEKKKEDQDSQEANPDDTQPK
jgi:Family of unknown function (DUF5681)